MRHATSLLYQVHAIASRNKLFTICGTRGKRTLWMILFHKRFSVIRGMESSERHLHYRPWRPTGDVDARVHIFTATTLEKCRVALPSRGRLYPLRKPRYSFYRRLSRPLDQSGHEGVKKNLHPSDTRDRTLAVQHVVKRLATWATYVKTLLLFICTYLVYINCILYHEIL